MKSNIIPDVSGNILWIRNEQRKPQEEDAAESVAFDEYKNLYATGTMGYLDTIISYPKRNNYSVKYNSSGEKLWETEYMNPTYLASYGGKIILDNWNNIITSGRSYEFSDFYSSNVTIKYDRLVNIKSIAETTGDFILYQNFPNPFNPSTVIRYSLKENSKVILRVYDISGKEVAKLVNEKQNSGMHSVEFSSLSLSSGVYFYKLEAGDFVQTRKMLLIK